MVRDGGGYEVGTNVVNEWRWLMMLDEFFVSGVDGGGKGRWRWMSGWVHGSLGGWKVLVVNK